MKKKCLFRILGLVVMLVASLQAVNAMTFVPSTDGRSIFATGIIEKTDNIRLAMAIEKAPSHLLWIMLESGGGDLQTGHKMAKMIRLNGLDTFIQKDKHCISACTDVFLGGVSRDMDPDGFLGYHGSSLSSESAWDGSLYNEAYQLGQVATMEDLMFVQKMIGINESLLSLWNKTLTRVDIDKVWYPDNQYLFDANILNVTP